MAAGPPANWTILYHPEVQRDLDSLGSTASARILDAIHNRLYLGEPDKAGKPLSGELAGWCRIRAGAFRIVYRIDLRRQDVYVLAVGPRRGDEVYSTALRRT